METPDGAGGDDVPADTDAGGDASADGGNDPDRSAGGNQRNSPLISGLLTDQGLIGPGRIVDATIAFTGTANRGDVVELYLNGQMAGSSMARDDGSWMLDYSLISLAPGTYVCTLNAVASDGSEIPSAATFTFIYDPSAPVAPIISGVTADSATALDGITSDNTLLIAGTAEPGSTLELFLNNVVIASVPVDGAGNWMVDYTAVTLPDGTYNLSAESIYLTLRSATSPFFPLLVDTQNPLAPLIQSINPDTGISTTDGITTNPNLILSGTAEPNAVVRVRLGSVLVGSTTAAVDGSWNFNYGAVNLAEGTHLFSALQMDRAGNTSGWSASFPVVVDVTPPAAVASLVVDPDSGNGSDGVTNANQLVISGTASPGDWVRIELAGSPIGLVQVDSNGDWELDYTATTLADGVYSVSAVASDVAGNLSGASSTLSVSVDTSAPAAPLISSFATDTGIVGDLITADTTPLLQGSAEAGSLITVLQDGNVLGTAVADGNGDWQFEVGGAGLAAGIYPFTATASDVAGNVSLPSAIFSLVIDTIVPAVPVVSGVSPDSGMVGDGVTRSSTLVFFGTAEIGVTVSVFVDGIFVGTVVPDGAGNWAFDYTGTTLAEGSHVISVLSTDDAGNLSALSAPWGITVDTGIPGAPVVTGISDDNGAAGDGVTSDNTLLVTGTAEPDVSVTVLIDGVSVGIETADSSGVWILDYTGTELADGTYAITAFARDAADNASPLSAPLSVSIDTQAPAVPAVSAISDDTGAALDGITSDDTLQMSGTAEANAQVTILLNGAPIGTVAADALGNWLFDYGGTALADNTYLVTATTSDGAGNSSAASAAFTVVVDTAAPAAPSFSGITTDTGVAGDGVTSDGTLLFSGTAEANASVNLHINGADVGSVTVSAGGNWTFDYTGTTLVDGSYSLTATATDSAGNVSPVTVAFNITIDTAMPAAPIVTGISSDSGTPGDGITSDSTLEISGTAAATTRVDVMFNGVSIGTTSADGSGNWSFDHTGVALADGSYGITATATSVSGNQSPVSAAFALVVDSTAPAAPVVSGITTDTGTAGDGITSDNTLVISGSAEADSSVNVLVDGASIGTVSADGSGVWSINHTGTTLADNTYAITATASDSAGNISAVSTALTVTIDSVSPGIPVVTGFSADGGVAGDGITNDNTLVFTGTADANVTVSILLDGGLIGATTANAGGNWTFDYSGTTLANGSYEITAQASDAAGNNSAESGGLPVTVDAQLPAIATLSPADGATNVAFAQNLVITLDETVSLGSGNIVIRHYIDDTVFESIPVGDARVTGGGTTTLTIDPGASFVGGTQYYVEIAAGAFSDVAGNGFAGVSGNGTWSFTVVPTTIISTTPVNGATAVALNTSLALTFNEPVFANVGNVLILRVSDDTIVDTIDVAADPVAGDGTDSIVLNQSGALEPNTAYYVEIEAGAFINGNNVAFAGVTGNSTLNFTTANESIPVVLTVTSTVADGNYRGGDTIPLQIQFSEVVSVTGTPQIYLDLDGADKYISYTSGSGTDTLQFDYQVATGDMTSDLDYVSSAALVLNGGAIRSVKSANANLTLAAPGAVGSLGANKDIVIMAASLDMSSFSSSDGFIISGNEVGDYFGRAVGSGGDINGDGFEDIVIGVSLSDLDSGDGGAAYVIFGQAGATRSDISVGSLSSGDGFLIRGASAADYLGISVSLAGDINGDGFDDAVVIASYSDAGAADAGTAYVIWGRAGATRADINLSTLTASDGFRILGYEVGDILGHTTVVAPENAQFIDASGDFNGDGIHDLLLGHHTSDVSGGDSGVVYLLFGQTGATRADIDLSNIAGQGFRITTGGAAGELLGQSVQFIKDYNGDGFNDIVVGAGLSDGVAADAGQAYVIFGHGGPAYNDIDVTSLSGSDGFRISTSEAASWLGGSVGATDINGDGLTDLLIGNVASDANGKGDSGSVLVLYGNDAASHADVVFGSVAVGDGFTIYGEDVSDFVAHAVKGAGDINGDGIGDLLVSTWVDDEGGVDAGAAWVVFGTTGTARGDIDLSMLTSIDGFKIIGDQAVDYFGRANTAGDVNGDGYNDLIVASPLGDDDAADGGEVNVIWGKDFSSVVFGGLTGNSSANNIVGTSGNDVIVGGGGADRISAGTGDDLVRVSDLGFARVDGGRGTDTLEIMGNGLALDLRLRNYETIQGIEVINLGGRGNGISLSKLSLLALSDQVRTLYVQGGSNDWVATDSGETWVANGTVVVNTVTYYRYDLDEVSLFVQPPLSQPTQPSAPSISGYATDTGVTGDGITADNRLVFSGTTGAYFTIEVFVDGLSAGTTVANAAGAWTFDHTATVLADGAHTILAQATNLAGYVSAASAALNVTVDASVPASPVVNAISTDTGAAVDGVTADNNLLISGTAEAGASINVRVDGVSIGSTVADGSGNWAFDHTGTAMADGNYAITATASDSAGNTSAVSTAFNIRIDTGVPNAPVVTGITSDSGTVGDGITNDTTLFINGTSEANVTINVLQNSVSMGTTTANGAGSWVFNHTGTVLAQGSYTFTAVATDGAGNGSVASTGFTVNIDTAAPLISSISPADDAIGVLPDANLVINFDSNVTVQSGNITIRRASDNAIFEQIPVGDARVTGSGTSTITINPAGNFAGAVGYYVQIDATAFADAAGNSFAGISSSIGWNFTSQTLDLVSSTPSDNATNVALNSAIILNFNTAALSNAGNIQIRHTSDGSIFETIPVGSAQVTGTGTTTVTIAQSDVFLPNTGYYVEIDAGAFVSGVGASFAGINGSSTLNFTTANPPVPVVTNVTSSNANGTYGQNDLIVVQVQFSDIVNVTRAVPRLTLDLDTIDRTVNYVSGSGSNTLVFHYTVKFGDTRADLDYLTSAALDLNGARIRSPLYVNANLTLPTPGAAGSLGANRNLVIAASELDVSTLGSADGFQVQGSSASEHVGWAVSGVGDVNGDGFEDFVAGAPYASTNAGIAYIVFGQAGSTRSNINTSTITNGTNGFRIIGQSATDYLASSEGGAGDVNDDGYDDVFVVAPRDDDYGTDAGIVYVIYGRASPTDVTISSFSSSSGFRITTSELSAAIGDSITGYTSNGQAIDSGGDFNGDGIQDMVIGIRFSDRSGADSGKAYVVFGRAGSTRSDVNLDLINPTGPDGVLIYGSAAGAQLGQAAQFVGDYDADGYDDIVVSALFSDVSATDGGQAFLVFGSPGPIFNAIDVTTLNGGSGFTIFSTSSFGVLGHSVAGGDFNGDGVSDLFVSQNGYSTNTGAGYVIYGDADGLYSNIDVDTMLSSTGYGIFGQSMGEHLGHSLANAGDFNADGIDDLLIASYLRDDNGADSGAAWLITGADGTARADLSIASLSTADGFSIDGGGVGDHFGQSTSFGDINGDGFSDLIIGAPWGDNVAIDGGETVVLWGREFATAVTDGLVGTAGDDTLVGTSGNDTLVGGGGLDVISAGAGNDRVQVSDTDFYKINGGEGTDTLEFVTGLNTLNLSVIGPEVIKGIEVIDLGDNGNTLQVTKAGVQALSRETRALFVRGGSSDAVLSTTGDAWCYTGTLVVNSVTYHVYLDNGAILYIESGINHSGVGSFNATQTYTFNTTSGGANVSSSVTSFPVLIRVSATIRNTLQASRADIRFTDRDRLTWLPYEVEIGASGEMFVWVLVPQIDGNSSSDSIVMHYNDKVNGAVPNRENPAKVWADYAGVWHFDEASGAALDSTAYQNNGTQTGTVSRESSYIGRGVRFDSSTERFTVPYDASFNVSGKNFTIELWLDGTGNCTTGPFAAKDYMTAVSRGEGTSRNWRVFTGGSWPTWLGGFVGSPGFSIADTGGSDTLNSTAWISTQCSNHMVIDHNRSYGTRVYFNGSLQFTDSSVRNMENLQSLIIGNSGGSEDMRIDELRIISQSLSAARAKLSYENQGSTSLVSPNF